jgi:hypothetical protein
MLDLLDFTQKSIFKDVRLFITKIQKIYLTLLLLLTLAL